jgi:ABC-2 type transport system ATP-binding protein
MLQRLGLAQALLGDPPLILLDEPAQGLDPTGQKNMRDQILDLHQAGKTIILSSHRLDEVTRTCTHVGILRGGRLVLSGELETLLAARHAQPAAPEPAVPDDPHQVSITTTDLPPALIATLSSLAPGITIAKRGITLSGGAVDHKAHILRLLLDAGVDIQELGRKQATLEEVYLEATRE